MATYTDKISYTQSNQFFTAKSKTFVSPNDGSYAVFSFPRYTLVSQVFVLITTAYAGGTPVLSVGWSGNTETAVADGFLSNDIFDPTATGLKLSTKDTLTSNQGKYFNLGSGLLTLTVAAGGATTEGTFVILANYSNVFM